VTNVTAPAISVWKGSPERSSRRSRRRTDLVGRDDVAATNPQAPGVRIVPRDAGVFDVQLETARGRVRIGKVSDREHDGRWAWEHRDGERSSPLADNLATAADALRRYHLAFKGLPLA
jgi:hypothetical protein